MPYLGNQHNVGDHVNNFKVLDDISSHTATFNGSATSVVSAADDTIRIPEHRFIQGQRVTYTNGGGGNIGGLTSGTAYFVSFDSANTIKLATTLANANSNTVINLSSVGSGTSHTLNAAFDGVNTKFKISYRGGTSARLNNATQINVAINNVIQRPNQSSLSFTEGFAIEDNHKIVFKVAPTVNDIFWGSIIANTIENFDLRDNEVDNFTGDGSTTEFTLSTIPANNESVMVSLDGVLQHPSDKDTSRSYTLLDSIIQFTAAPGNGVEIQVRHIGFAGASTNDVSGFYGRSGNVTLTANDHITTGDITSRNINSSGIITATSFVGSGANLTGIDATAVKDASGNVKIQAQASGAIYTGIHTFTTLKSSSGDFSGNVSIGGTLTYEDVTNIDSVGIITARDDIKIIADNKKLKLGAGEELELYQDGNHSNIKHNGGNYLRLLSNAHIMMDAAGSKNVFIGDPNGQSALYFNGSKKLNTLNGGVDITGSLQVDSFHCLGPINLDSDIDVEGHTNLDNVSVAGVSTFSDNVRIVDNKSLLIGDLSNGDLSLVHDGNNSVIRNRTGDLYISNATQTGFFLSGSTGDVRLNYGGDLKLETESTGVKVTGKLRTTGDLDIDGHTNLDNVSIAGVTTATGTLNSTGGIILTANMSVASDTAKVFFGASNDLSIYHNGSHSYIDDTGTGNLKLRSNNLRISNADESKLSATFQAAGAVELYHDNSKKLETTSSGSTLSGDLLLDSANAEINLKAGVGSNTGAINWTFNTTGTDYSSVKLPYATRATDGLIVDGGSYSVSIKHGSEYMAKLIGDGAVELYHNNSKKFETTSDGTTFSGSALFPDNQRIKIGGTASSPDLQLWHDASNSYIRNDTGYMVISTENGSTYYDANNHIFRKADSSEDMAKFLGDGSVQLYHDGTQKFQTTSTGVNLSGTIHTIVGDFYPSNDNNDRLGLSNRRWSQIHGYEINAHEFVKFYDNIPAKFGTGDDFQIVQNGTSAFIDNHNQGHIYIRNNDGSDFGGNIYIQGKSGEASINIIHDGAVELYHNNSKKLETFSSGVQVTGALNVTTTMFIPDGSTGLQIGNSNDTRFYHSGSHSYIKHTGTGNFYVDVGANDYFSVTSEESETIIQAQSNGAVELFYNGSKKAETVTGGFTVTGDLTATGFVDSSSDIKLKTNIKTIDNALDKVLQLRGAEYDRIDRDNQHEIGVIAQEVEKIIPEVVHGEETKTVSYGNMVAILIEAMKEQNEIINKMKKEIEDLKG